MIHVTRQLLLQVRELMERTHSNVFEIACRMNLDPDDVKQLIELVNQLFT